MDLHRYVSAWTERLDRLELPSRRPPRARKKPPLVGWRKPPPVTQRQDLAVAYQAAGTVATNTAGGNASPSWPAHATDDYAILVVVQGRTDSSTAPAAATLTTANGFTAVASGSQAATYDDGFLTHHAVRVTLFECRATSAAMSAPTVAGIASNAIEAYIITFRGAATSGSAVDVVSSSAIAGAPSTSFSVSGTTPSVASTVVLACCAAVSTAAGTTAGSWTNSDLSSLTSRVDNWANNVHTASATGGKAAATAYGSTTATLTSAETWAGITVAIKPPTVSTSNLLLMGVG